MSTPSNDSLAAQIEARGLRVGNLIKVQDGGSDAATTSSTTIYSDSSGKLAVGTIPFAVPVSAPSTTSAVLDFTGSTSLSSGGGTMTQTLVTAAGATTVTSAGFVRVNITDSGGNLTNGGFYLQVYTIV